MTIAVALVVGTVALGLPRPPVIDSATTMAPAVSPVLQATALPPPLQRDDVLHLRLRYAGAPSDLSFELDRAEVSPWLVWDGADGFEALVGPVSDGAHRLLVRAGRGAVLEVSVAVDTTPPPIDATASFGKTETLVTGTTEPATRLEANGRAVSVDASGRFKARLPAESTRAGVELRAYDEAGNVAVRRLRPTPPTVRGLYLTAYSAAWPERRRGLFDRAVELGLNAVVIDVKDSSGHVYIDVGSEDARTTGAVRPYLDRDELFTDLRKHHLYAIARVVCFEDPVFAEARPEAAFRVGGELWRDDSGLAWLDPRSEEARRYLVEVVRGVAALGFDEIQLDFVRFPTGQRQDLLDRGTRETRVAAIDRFIDEVAAALESTGVFLSADLFGLTATVMDDMQIGQELAQVAARVDAVSPMMYPSHYAVYSYGLPDPDAAPAAVVDAGVRDALAKMRGTRAQLRPWLQSFSLRHRYGPAQVRAQIEAAAAQGVEGFLLWDPWNVYEGR